MPIYVQMEKNWQTYCLMSAIAYIEEMSKPIPHIQIKKYKDRTYRCECFSSIRLKMKDEEVVKKFFEITKSWEEKIKQPLIGKTFEEVRKENYSGQDMFLLTPLWLNHIIKECGKIPNRYSFETAIRRISNLKHYTALPIDAEKDLFKIMLENKQLAAGAFIVSMDLEFRGIQSGSPSLCMSEKYKDFLESMLKIASKWGWTNNKALSKVNLSSSLKRGINASPQYEFRLSIKGLREIYSLAGPLANKFKDKCISFHVNRSKRYKNLGGKMRENKTKQRILNAISKSKDLTSTTLQFIAGVRIDVILKHLHSLEKNGQITKQRRGKRYIWNLR